MSNVCFGVRASSHRVAVSQWDADIKDSPLESSSATLGASGPGRSRYDNAGDRPAALPLPRLFALPLPHGLAH